MSKHVNSPGDRLSAFLKKRIDAANKKGSKRGRRGGSRKGEQRGRNLEVKLEAHFKKLRLLGLADIIHIPTPVQLRGLIPTNILHQMETGARWKEHRCRLLPRVSVDWGGTFKGGHSTWGESKTTKLKTRVDFNEAVFTNHQKETLLRHARLGAVTWVWIRCSSLSRDWLIPVTSSGPIGLNWSNPSVPMDEMPTKFMVPRGKSLVDAVLSGAELIWPQYKEKGWAICQRTKSKSKNS